MKTVIAILALGLAPALASAQCVVENDEIALVGALSRETVAGPPNYESVGRGDRAETHWILTIRDPITFCAIKDVDGNSHTLGSVNRFQLLLNDGQRGVTQALIARHAAVTGRIVLRHPGNQHNAVLIEVTDLRPATRSSLSVR